MATARDAITAAEDRLLTARFGLDDMLRRPERIRSGLMMQWCLDSEMRDDPVMSFFYGLRTQIEKQAHQHTGTRTYISRYDASVRARFEPAPPHAEGFFIGAENGGSGWVIRRADGSTEKYYIDMPPELAKTDILITATPSPCDNVPATVLLEEYLDKLQKLIDEAKALFLPSCFTPDAPT